MNMTVTVVNYRNKNEYCIIWHNNNRLQLGGGEGKFLLGFATDVLFKSVIVSIFERHCSSFSFFFSNILVILSHAYNNNNNNMGTELKLTSH